MNTNEFLAKVESIAAEQGWTENTLLDLALRFLGDSDPHDRERFLDFLAEARDQENEKDSEPENDGLDWESEGWDDVETPEDGGDMDGDAESALASAGFGTDEDYGGCCDNDPDDF